MASIYMDMDMDIDMDSNTLNFDYAEGFSDMEHGLAEELKRSIELVERKGLVLLLFYCDGSTFSETFTLIQEDASITELITNSMRKVTWNICDRDRRTVLGIILKRHLPELPSLRDYLYENKSAAFCISKCISEEAILLTQININNFNFSNTLTLFRNVVEIAKNEKASNAFAEYFFKKHGRTDINISGNIPINNHLKDERNLAILYYHHEDDLFSQNMCRWLSSGPLCQFLSDNRHFLLSGWDIKHTEYGIMKNILRSVVTDDHPEIESMLLNREAGMLILGSYGGDIFILAEINDKLSESEVMETILQIEEDVSERIKERDKTAADNDDEMNAIKFQQLMCDKLGDRDYDSFTAEDHSELKDKIGFAYFGMPTDVDQRYTETQLKIVKRAYELIVQKSNAFSEFKNQVIVSFIYICRTAITDDSDILNANCSDFIPVPVFILRKCFDCPRDNDNACRIIIDSDLRVYKSWPDFLLENNLPQCVIYTPTNGRYRTSSDEKVLLSNVLSPACKTSKRVLKVSDGTSMVVGVGTGAVMMIGAIPAVAFAPAVLAGAGVVGAAAGVYTIARSVFHLADRAIHEETMSITDAEARGAYINIVAGSLGFVGAGANILLANLAANGDDIGMGVLLTVNAISKANLAAGGISVANSAYDIASRALNKEPPSPLALVQLSASILFFGNAVYNFKCASTIVSEAQSQTMEQINDSFRSNRHRKTFNKLYKETVSANGGNVAKANAQVISTIKKMPSIDDAFASLTRNNKKFNEMGIKFSAKDGVIALNGKAIDMNQLIVISDKTSINELLLTESKNISANPVKSTSGSSFNIPYEGIGTAALQLVTGQITVERGVQTILAIFIGPIQIKIVSLLNELMDNFELGQMLRSNVFNIPSQYYCLLDIVLNYCYNEGIKRLNIQSNGVKKSLYLVKIVISHFFMGRPVTALLVNELLDYAKLSLTALIMRMIPENSSALNTRNRRRKCSQCEGYFFS